MRQSKTSIIYVILILFQLWHTSVFFVIAQDTGSMQLPDTPIQGEEKTQDTISIDIPSLPTTPPPQINIPPIPTTGDKNKDTPIIKTPITTGKTTPTSGQQQPVEKNTLPPAPPTSSEKQNATTETGTISTNKPPSTGNTTTINENEVGNNTKMTTGTTALDNTVTLYDTQDGEELVIEGQQDNYENISEITVYDNDEGEEIVITTKEKTPLPIGSDRFTIQGQLFLEDNGDSSSKGVGIQRSRIQESKLSRAHFKDNTQVKSMIKGIVTIDDLRIRTLDASPEGFGNPVLAGVKLGPDDDHLVFSQPVQIDIPVDRSLNNETVAIYVQHLGDDKYSTVGLTTDPLATCTEDGFVSITHEEEQLTINIIDNTATIYTCGASIFVVTYTGGPTFNNFVDNSSTGKVITVTSGDVAPGSIIQDVNVIVDFHKIDGENPATPGAGSAYSPEASFMLQSPLGTTINLMTTNTYTNNANAPRVTVTFDDSAGSAPTNLPVTGTFLPTDNLSAFVSEDPIGDWIFTFADNANQDGLILYSVSLQIDAQELCGDGTLNIGEGCDDGNTTSGDGCSLACNVEIGYACNTSSPGLTGHASCNSGVCDFSETPDVCEAANTCGNNKIELGEECDDGNTTSNDGCSFVCEIEFCGNGTIDSTTSNGTLFLENFESIGNGTVTTNTTLVSSSAYSLFYENNDATGRARYGNQRVQDNGGAGAITLDVNPSGTYVQNYLIFQVDLTSAISATDLALAFDFSHHGEESHTTDRVRIRGSKDDIWIEIYDRDTNKGSAGTYTSVTNLDIDATLYANNQYPSSTFQIRFGQEDNFPATSTTASDGLSLDNVQITGTPIGPTSTETCDDANMNNSDGCSQSCNIEGGWTCSGTPSVCTLIPAPTGLQLHYNGSQGGGFFTDISGNGYNGTPYNGVTTSTVNGETVMCFNGTNQYIERVTNLATSYPFTMSAWVKASNTAGNNGIMSFARSSVTNRMYNIEHNGTTIRGNAQNTTARYVNASTVLNTSAWFLVSTVFTSDTSRDIYINGVYEGTNTQNATYDTNTTKRLNIARFADSTPNGYFNGCLDDTRFYTSALTSAQIYNLYARPAALSTNYTVSASPLLTGTIQGTLDNIALTINGNTYTGTNNGNGTRTLPASTINPRLPSGTYPTILTVTNPYGRVVTYNTSFVVDLPPTLCGNGVIDSGEQCDDGFINPGDGCDNLCQIEAGYACGGEPSVCSVCGNGLVDGPGEVCDDNNGSDGDGCSSSCQIEFCGNNVIDLPTTPGSIFSEDFEGIGNGTLTSNGTIYTETGYTLSFETSGTNGRVNYGNTAIQNNGGNGAATMDVNPTGTYRVNYLIFTLDLNQALRSTDLELSFDRTDHGEENHTNDRVRMRGSTSDAWIEIYDRNANDIGNGVYQTVGSLDIDALLASNSQTVSSTFQIRFGQEDNFTAISTTANDGFSVDNVEITGTIPGPSIAETCDDGNTSNGDGCDSTCQIESSSGNVSIFSDSTFTFSGAIYTDDTPYQIVQQFTGYFEVDDQLGIDSGYYTTLQITDFSGSVYGQTIANSNLEWYATGMTLLSGDINANVVLATGRSSYRTADTTYTFIKRDPGVNSNKKGTYGTLPRLRLTIPPYMKADAYQATITYTLYE